jgi:hypothetical protein
MGGTARQKEKKKSQCHRYSDERGPDDEQQSEFRVQVLGSLARICTIGLVDAVEITSTTSLVGQWSSIDRRDSRNSRGGPQLGDERGIW